MGAQREMKRAVVGHNVGVSAAAIEAVGALSAPVVVCLPGTHRHLDQDVGLSEVLLTLPNDEWVEGRAAGVWSGGEDELGDVRATGPFAGHLECVGLAPLGLEEAGVEVGRVRVGLVYAWLIAVAAWDALDQPGAVALVPTEAANL